MRRVALGFAAASLLFGCNRKGEDPAPPPASSAPAPSVITTPASASVATPAPRLPLPTHEGGALVRAPEDDALYLADEDHGVVRRIPLPFDPEKPTLAIPVPGLPAQVLSLGDRVLVTVRAEGGVPPSRPQAAEGAPAGKKAGPPPLPTSPTGPGLLLVMKPDPQAGLVEIARVRLPQDAWGVAVTPDRSIALVTSAWTHQVSAVDLASAKKLWSLDVPREPRAVVARPDGKSVYVTHLVGAALTRIDDLTGAPRVTTIPLPPSPLRAPLGKTLAASLAYTALLSPDGHRLLVPRHAIGALGEEAWFGAATVDVLATADDTPLAPRREATSPRVRSDPMAGVSKGVAVSSQGQFPLVDVAPFTAPRAAVIRKSRATVLVASEGGNTLVELDARAIDPSMFVKQSIKLGRVDDALSAKPDACSAPSGVALSADESTAWVFCRASRGLVQVRLDPIEKKQAKAAPPRFSRLSLADDLLGRGYNSGRRLFYDGYAIGGGLSCAACHPEGRDDGHVWHEAKFEVRGHLGTSFLGAGDQAPLASTERVGHPRQTPMLAGRVSAPGPYGWHAQSADFAAQVDRGAALHDWGEGDPPPDGVANAVASFVRYGLVPPPREARAPTPEEAKGEALFLSEKTRCATCHVPATGYTDRVAYTLAKQPALPGFEDEEDTKWKTPSLLFVGGTAPYYHDGRAATLEALVEQNGDRMGHTSHLSAEERAALVAFMRSL